MLIQMSAAERGALFGACERGIGALVRKGSRNCHKAARAIHKSHDLPDGAMPADVVLAREIQRLLRARCGVCPFRFRCKAPLSMD